MPPCAVDPHRRRHAFAKAWTSLRCRDRWDGEPRDDPTGRRMGRCVPSLTCTISAIRCAKPTVAAVNGAAVAGGTGLMTVCDLAVAVPAAKFGYPEVRRGLVAAIVMPHLLRHVGERMARWLLLTGELIDAEAAGGRGLINRVVPGGRQSWRRPSARQIAGRGGPNALAQTKALLASVFPASVIRGASGPGPRGAAPDRGVPAGPDRLLQRTACPVGARIQCRSQNEE